MAACGLPVSAVGVAQVYAPWLDTIVLDQRDAGLAGELAALGVSTVTTDTLMTSPEKEIALARRILDALR
jgi:LPPG:FO 2-phospho-L-lactate transferase